MCAFAHFLVRSFLFFSRVATSAVMLAFPSFAHSDWPYAPLHCLGLFARDQLVTGEVCRRFSSRAARAVRDPEALTRAVEAPKKTPVRLESIFGAGGARSMRPGGKRLYQSWQDEKGS